MNRGQYDFSNMFWEDPQYNLNDGIPKCYEIINDNMIFHYLDVEETKTFMKIKAKENPEIMKDIRYKKLLRILKIN
jgi:hypothetical protein